MGFAHVLKVMSSFLDIVTFHGGFHTCSCSSTSPCVFPDPICNMLTDGLNDFADIQTMLAGSGAVITKKHTEFAIGGLLGVVIVQGFGYGLIFDLNFFLRNLSVIGGLFMVFSDSMITRRTPFAGLPTISENDRKK